MLLGTELLLALSDGGNGGRADLGDWNDLPLRSLNLLATALPSGGVSDTWLSADGQFGVDRPSLKHRVSFPPLAVLVPPVILSPVVRGSYLHFHHF